MLAILNYCRMLPVRVRCASLREFALPDSPRFINFEVTDACNSRCKHCNIWRKPTRSSVLRVNEIEAVFHDPTLSKLEQVILTGGEPFLRNDLWEIVQAIHESRPTIEIHIATNGLLIDRITNLVDKSVEENIRLHLSISLDGIGQVHDYIRGIEGAFEKTNTLVLRLREISLPSNTFTFHVNFTLSSLNCHTFKSTLEYVKKLGVKLGIQMYEQSTYFNSVENMYGSLSQISRQVVKYLTELGPNPYLSYLRSYLSSGKIKKFPCFSMFAFCVIRCNGNVVPCMRKYWNTVIGNLKVSTFSDIWYSKKAKAVRNSIKACRGCLCACELPWSISCLPPPQRVFH